MLFYPTDSDLKLYNEAKSKKEIPSIISTIKTGEVFNKFHSEDTFYPYENTVTTTVKNNMINVKTATTWEEINNQDFDIISKFVPNKSFKIKARVKKVSNYNPKIIIS